MSRKKTLAEAPGICFRSSRVWPRLLLSSHWMGLSFSVLLGTKASSPEPPNEQLSSILSSSNDLLSGRPLLVELEYLFVKLCSCCSCSCNDWFAEPFFLLRSCDSANGCLPLLMCFRSSLSPLSVPFCSVFPLVSFASLFLLSSALSPLCSLLFQSSPPVFSLRPSVCQFPLCSFVSSVSLRRNQGNERLLLFFSFSFPRFCGSSSCFRVLTSLLWSATLLLLRCCADGADSPLHCYYWCKGDGRTVVDKGNMLGLNIYTSGDAGSLLQEDWIVSIKMTGIYRYQRAWCRERCVHYSNMVFRPIQRSRGAWEQRGLDHSLGLLFPWFFVFDHKWRGTTRKKKN